MKVPTLFTLVVVLGYHMASACPPVNQLEQKVKTCLSEMMKFVHADDSERRSKCPNLKEGVDCVDDILEACKDNAALQGQYDMLKERLSQSRKDFEGFCGMSKPETTSVLQTFDIPGGSGVTASSSLFLILSACVLSLWLRK